MTGAGPLTRKLRRSRVPITLWGSPIWKPYRVFSRELSVFSDQVTMVIQHRHHGVAPEDQDEQLCAEVIEACEAQAARRCALAWFVAHGRDGLQLPIERLASQLGIGAGVLPEALASGLPRERVARDVEEARALGFPAGLVVVANGQRFAGPLDALSVLRSAVELDPTRVPK